jgi:Sigma-70, region 4
MAHSIIAAHAHPLERRYRLLLLAYPADYRRDRGDEIVGTLLDTAEPGQTWPRTAEVADLVGSGLRRRLRIDQVSGLAGGISLAAPIALALAAGLSAFLLAWFELRLSWPAAPRLTDMVDAVVQTPVTLGTVVYAGWILAALAWPSAAPVTARTAVALATATTVGVLPVAALTPLHRPPLWTTLALTALGLIALAGGAVSQLPVPVWRRLFVPVGALAIAAAATGYLFVIQPRSTRWWEPYYGTAIAVSGVVAAAVVAAVAAVALAQALRRRPVRPWLWAGLLLALPGGWLGPLEFNPPDYWAPMRYLYYVQFGRLAQVLAASCVVVVVMVWLRRNGLRAQATAATRRMALTRATAAVVGCGAGLAVIQGYSQLAQLPYLLTDSGAAMPASDAVVLTVTLCWVIAAAASAALPGSGLGGVMRLASIGVATLICVAWPPVDWLIGRWFNPSGVVLGVLGLVAFGGMVATGMHGTGQWQAVLAGAVATTLAATVVMFYNTGWELGSWQFDSAAPLIGTLMLVPLAGVALTGATRVRWPWPGSRLRWIASWATVTLSVASIAAMTLPYLASWGPVLMLVSAVAAVAAAFGFIVARRAANDPVHEERFRAYTAANQARLFATAYLLCGDGVVADRLVRAVLARVFLAWHRLPDAVAVDACTRRALVHAAARIRPPASNDPLYRLPASQRTALVLTLHDGLTPAEIADALDCAVADVRRLTERALARCAS